MEQWRYIFHGADSGTRNMAIDSAISKSVASGLPPTLRVYRWSPPTVTIGYFQIRDDETDYPACMRDNIPVLRRITGGGAVFHEHEITYSISIPLRDKRISGTIVDSYKLILQPIIATLGALSIPAEFSPINDITVQGKKISGSAQTRRDGVLLQHGTLLISVNEERMFRYLKVSGQKVKGQGHTNPLQRITALDRFLGEGACSDRFILEISERIMSSFSNTFGVGFFSTELTMMESECASAIESQFFQNESWNNKRGSGR